MKYKVTKPIPNWLGWIKWRKLYTPHVITCCDCGLAHRFEYKVEKNTIYWRAKRDKEATKLARIKK